MAKKQKKAPDAGEARIEYRRLSDVRPAKRNPKLHDLAAIKASILRHGFVAPPIEDARTGRIVAGHGRKEAVEEIRRETPDKPPARVKVDADGEWMIPVVVGVAFASEAAAEEYLIGDNRIPELGGWDNAGLSEMLGEVVKRGQAAIAAIGWSPGDIAEMLGTIGHQGDANGARSASLAERFLVPPFSVLDARQGYWQDRKRAWLALGIKSELGRVAPIGGGPMPLDRAKQAGGAAFQQTSEREVAMKNRTGSYATGRRRAAARGQQ